MEAAIDARWDTNPEFLKIAWSSSAYVPADYQNSGGFNSSSTDQPWNDIEKTEEYISGFWNTVQILDADPNAPAAKACDEYRGGGYEDWFLPCVEELEELIDFMDEFNPPFGLLGLIWSSTQCPEPLALGPEPQQLYKPKAYYCSKWGTMAFYKGEEFEVIPFRAF